MSGIGSNRLYRTGMQKEENKTGPILEAACLRLRTIEAKDR
ncbi:MAG: hypothetical protein AAGL24_22230 [Pseudomonadota bacterium]